MSRLSRDADRFWVAPVIAIVDDNESVRDSLSSLLRSEGYATTLHESPDAFLTSGRIDDTSCLILDVLLSGENGLDVQPSLADAKPGIPIIVVSPASDAVRTRALAQGAVGVPGEPFSPDAFLDAIHWALHCS